MSRRALIAWEIGGGRGHVVHLATVAAELARRGFSNSAYLVHTEYASEIAPHCEAVAEGPYFPYRRDTDPFQLSTRYSDWLGLHHFDDPAVIKQAIASWRKIIDDTRPDVMVAEQSPCAILAARSLGLPVVHVGVPVTAPPAEMACFPSYLPDDRPPLYDETVMCRAVNEAIAEFGLPPLRAFPAVYTSDDEIPATIALLDRYAEWRRHRRVPPVIGGTITTRERRRTDVIVYLSTSDRFDPVILTAIATLPLPTRVVIAGNVRSAIQVASLRGTRVEERPLSPDEIGLAARVLVHAGNHGFSCLGLRLGLPHVTLSAQPEHMFDGRCIADAGAGRNVEPKRWTVPNIHAAVQETWSDHAMAQRAAELAEELAPEFKGDPGELTADRIEAVMR